MGTEVNLGTMGTVLDKRIADLIIERFNETKLTEMVDAAIKARIDSTVQDQVMRNKSGWFTSGLDSQIADLIKQKLITGHYGRVMDEAVEATWKKATGSPTNTIKDLVSRTVRDYLGDTWRMNSVISEKLKEHVRSLVDEALQTDGLEKTQSVLTDLLRKKQL